MRSSSTDRVRTADRGTWLRLAVLVLLAVALAAAPEVGRTGAVFTGSTTVTTTVVGPSSTPSPDGGPSAEPSPDGSPGATPDTTPTASTPPASRAVHAPADHDRPRPGPGRERPTPPRPAP